MTIEPQTLGEGAASKLIDWLRGDQPSIGVIDRVGISCNPAHLKQLNIKVPAELLGTITSR